MDKRTTCRSCAKEVGYQINKCVHCGKTDPLDIEDEIPQLIETGQRIEAVKRVVELTKVGLRVSKEYVDSIASGN